MAVILVARQNGKSTVSQVLALWRMYVDRSPLVIGTAQSLDIAEEVWSLSVDMARGTPELDEEIESISMAAGKKALILKGGQRYKVASANRRGGRSLSGDLVLLDELREHTTWEAWAAVTKTTMARPRPQTVCLSNAGDDRSIVLNHQREIGLTTLSGELEDDKRFGLFEWSAPEGCDIHDRDGWAWANPSLGYLIPEDAIEAAAISDPEWIFRTEVLCQRVQLTEVAPLPDWPRRVDPSSKLTPGDPVAFAVDVSWSRESAWIVAAGRRPDGLVHLEVVATGEGTDWVAGRLKELVEKWSPVAVAYQANGAPVSSLPFDSSAIGLSGPDLGKACGSLYDAVATGAVVHAGQEPLTDAAATATIRPYGDAWLFDRKKSPCDVAPLLAAAEALWALSTTPKPSTARAVRRVR